MEVHQQWEVLMVFFTLAIWKVPMQLFQSQEVRELQSEIETVLALMHPDHL